MKVFGISISYEEIEIDNESDYRGAIADGAVGNYLDPELSYLRGGGTVIVDAGHVIDPYGHGNDDLLELLAPVLEHVDTAVLAHYVLDRLAEHMANPYEGKPIEELGEIISSDDYRNPGAHKRNYDVPPENIGQPIDFAGPTGRELPGEHWNARIIRETVEAAHKARLRHGSDA